MEEMADPESTVENTEECEAIRKGQIYIYIAFFLFVLILVYLTLYYTDIK